MPEGFERIAITETVHPNIFKVLKAVKPSIKPFAIQGLLDEVQDYEKMLSHMDGTHVTPGLVKLTNFIVFIINTLNDLQNP